jgi:hypothetical protein
MLGITAFIKQHFQPRVRAQFEMMATLGAALQMAFKVLFPEDLLALIALHPKALGLDALILGRCNRVLFSAEPSHRNLFIGS